MRHDEKPIQDPDPQHDALAASKLEAILSSSYFEYLRPLKAKLKGKIVTKCIAGTSGFFLFFSEDEWVVSYLSGMKLLWKMGKGELNQDLINMINSPIYGDGAQPLTKDLPYASETCDIGKEIANAVGKEVTGIAIGEKCFDFCFPDGMELDATIVPTADQKFGLRVFWEQW